MRSIPVRRGGVTGNNKLPVIPPLSQLARTPSNPDGTWSGQWPLLPGAAVPPNRIHVVYTLFDESEAVQYVGCTSRFRVRMKDNQRGKSFAAWTATPYPTRAEADEAETALIWLLRPPLNRLFLIPGTSPAGCVR